MIPSKKIKYKKNENKRPPSNAYANSADAPYIPMPKGRGFNGALGKMRLMSSEVKAKQCEAVRREGFSSVPRERVGFPIGTFSPLRYPSRRRRDPFGVAESSVRFS